MRSDGVINKFFYRLLIVVLWGGFTAILTPLSFCTMEKVLQYIDKENLSDSLMTSETTEANPN